jgi:hypothetical protein
MIRYTTTVPTYVRTAAGTVKVDSGEHVPDDVLPAEITRLAAAGVIVEGEQAHDSVPPVADVKPPASPRRGRSRGQSGATLSKPSPEA